MIKTTTIDDYIEELHEQFPEVTEKQIKKIMVYGLKMMLQYFKRGMDIIVDARKLIYFGRMYKNGISWFKHYSTRLSRKIRYMFKRRRLSWDGYFYFGVKEDKYLEYLKQNRRKVKTFKRIFVYMLLDECKAEVTWAEYIFRVKNDNLKHAYKRFFEEFKCENPELIMQRDSMNGQDILISNNKYKYI